MSTGVTVPSATAATDPYCTEQSVYRDTWCSWYYSRNYYLNSVCAADPNYGRVGVRFIRLSDGAVLYRYFGNDCVDSGVVAASCREAHAANGGTHTWMKINAAAAYNTDC
jgi:hypothetical protein